jgi:glycyl-tRNA synthetase beta chain
MTRALLVEIGTEELPPKALRQLSEALVAGLRQGLAAARLEHGEIRGFATPRRLAVRVAAVAERQPDTRIEKLGPALSAAYDAGGRPTPAAIGFARACGLDDPAELDRVDTDKGPRLCFATLRPGAGAGELIPDLVAAALRDLPIPRRMRWGASREEFVRPVHWVVLLFGDQVLEAEILGVRAGRHTRGHRVHAPAEFAVTSPESYETQLESAYVMADFETRRERIRSGVQALAETVGGSARIDPELLDEVTALNEWPVPLLGRFDAQFLNIPREALISSMQGHQKYFPVVAAEGTLLPWFIAVANLDSRRPELVVAGNERVIRPRFADAAFFWSSDLKTSLAARREQLRTIVYQGRLGSLFDKTARVAELAGRLAPLVGADPAHAVRAAELAKSDLVSAMVQEFGELQGIMGRYCAANDGEPAAVAEALFEQYLPRHAGDLLPATPTGIALALAERIDTLAGIFSIGEEPTGSRYPFGLRRAAIAVLRILIERELDLDLLSLFEESASRQPGCGHPQEVARRVFDYVAGRLRALGEERGIVPEALLAVSGLGIHRPLDLWRRMEAVNAFIGHPDAPSLILTDKRIAHLLQLAASYPAVDPQRFAEPAELELWAQLQHLEQRVHGAIARRDYRAALEDLAALRHPVDRFFEDVLVMAEDSALRNNRLALLGALRRTLSAVADLSQLAARVGAQ